MSRAYVRFAAVNRPLFEALFYAGLDKSRYPELQRAAQPLTAKAFSTDRRLPTP